VVKCNETRCSFPDPQTLRRFLLHVSKLKPLENWIVSFQKLTTAAEIFRQMRDFRPNSAKRAEIHTGFKYLAEV